MIFAAFVRCLISYECHNNGVKMTKTTAGNRPGGRYGSIWISGMFSFLSGMRSFSTSKKPPKISRLLMS